MLLRSGDMFDESSDIRFEVSFDPENKDGFRYFVLSETLHSVFGCRATLDEMTSTDSSAKSPGEVVFSADL